MAALRSLLHTREKERMWQAYTAEMMYAAAKANYKEFPFPPYSEYIKKPTKQSQKTAEELKEELLSRLKGSEPR